MRRWLGILAATLSTAVIVWAVTVNGSLEILGTLRANVVDFSSSATTAPMRTGTSLPGGCAVGQAFFKTDAAAGQNIYLCTAANTWTQVQGSSGTFDGKRDPRYVVLEAEFANAYNYGSSPNYWASFGDFVFYRAGSGGFNYTQAASSNRVGVAKITTTTTANDRQRWIAQILSTSSDSDTLYAQTNKPWEIVYIFRLPNSADLTNVEFYTCYGASSDADPQAGIGVRFASASDTQFTFYASSTAASYGSTLASGVTADTNWHKFKIRADGTTAYKAWVSLDDGTERSVCASGCDLTLATTGTYGLRAYNFSIKTTDTLAKTLEMDYLRFWMDWGTR